MKQLSNAEFNGQCAFAVSVGKKDVKCDGSHYVIQNDKKYLFSNPVAKFLWKVLPGRKQKAESNWLTRQKQCKIPAWGKIRIITTTVQTKKGIQQLCLVAESLFL